MKPDPYGWHGCPLEQKRPAWPYILVFVLGILIMTGVPAP